MKNSEIIDLYDEVNKCLAQFHQTKFCLGLSHNKRRLQPIIDGINEAIENARPKADNFKVELQSYQDKVNETLRDLAIKDPKGNALMAGPGAYRLTAESMEKATGEIKKVREGAGELVGKYLDKFDEIRKIEYEKPIDFYMIKQENLPENLGSAVDKLYPLIGE